jgi:hypothetical protein
MSILYFINNIFMKRNLLFLLLFSFLLNCQAQTPVTSVSTTNSTATSATTYSIATNTYNWGVSPNNQVVNLNNFTAASVNYTYASALNGIVKLRRVNNAKVTGNFSLVWAETSAAGNFNMLPQYESDMEVFFDGKIYNRGTDNFFDNSSGNCNNIERMDWILASGYATASPSKVGFLVVERGIDGAHDAFCIAPILLLDANGDPATYGAIKRVTTAQYGDLPTSSVNYRIAKAAIGTNLADAGSGTQNRGGVLLSYADLGVTANTTIYGYSLFANDLPVTATPTDLVNVNNATFFPTNTGTAGGIDLVGITGIYIETTLLPNTTITLTANEQKGLVKVFADVEQNDQSKEYVLERSVDGNIFDYVSKQNAIHSIVSNRYTFEDNIANLNVNTIYYRVKQVQLDGQISYSKIISINKNTQTNLNFYPNPVKAYATLQVNMKVSGNVHIQLHNAAGVLVQQQDTKLLQGQNSIPLNGLQNLKSGWYILKINTESNTVLYTQTFQKL